MMTHPIYLSALKIFLLFPPFFSSFPWKFQLLNNQTPNQKTAFLVVLVRFWEETKLDVYVPSTILTPKFAIPVYIILSKQLWSSHINFFKTARVLKFLSSFFSLWSSWQCLPYWYLTKWYLGGKFCESLWAWEYPSEAVTFELIQLGPLS